MSAEVSKTVKIMVSMPQAIHNQLDLLSERLGSSKSKIVQQAIILMIDQIKGAGYVVD